MTDDDFLKDLQKSGKKKVELESGLSDVGATEVQEATEGDIPKSVKAGQYVRRTLTLSKGQIGMLRRINAELNIPQAAAARWLLDIGIQAYLDGERPESGFNVTSKEW